MVLVHLLLPCMGADCPPAEKKFNIVKCTLVMIYSLYPVLGELYRCLAWQKIEVGVTIFVSDLHQMRCTNGASKIIGTVIKCLFTNCVYKSLPVNRFRTEWVKLHFCAVWSHCFSRYWKKCSPQWWWLVVDMYLAVLHGSVNIHH